MGSRWSGARSLWPSLSGLPNLPLLDQADAQTLDGREP
jgi:hypothetical protein